MTINSCYATATQTRVDDLDDLQHLRLNAFRNIAPVRTIATPGNTALTEKVTSNPHGSLSRTLLTNNVSVICLREGEGTSYTQPACLTIVRNLLSLRSMVTLQEPFLDRSQ